jgi:hypothetical protein
MVPIDSASPRGAGDARSLHNHPDANPGIVGAWQVTGDAIADAFAGEGGTAASKRDLSWCANGATGWARNRS